MQRFYATVNGAQHKSVPMPAMCNDWDGKLLIDKTIMVERACTTAIAKPVPL